ncbi:MAG: type 4a pilus biogenesis protein PilO [Candidatus Omnitrophica bacterium]|nr:type 4a pilus biogenesis protein PilO [Candidatus Omnitrophota bacterium]
MEKPMKGSLKLIMWAGILLVCCLMAALFVMQFKVGITVRRDLAATQKDLRDAMKASRKMEELENREQELRQKEAGLSRRVAVNEKEPLPLLKVLTGIATKEGMRKIRFVLLKQSALPLEGAAALPAETLQPLYIQMDAEAAFPQVLSFLERLAGLERIVQVERAEISRRKEAVPYQAVTLNLVTYSFKE